MPDDPIIRAEVQAAIQAGLNHTAGNDDFNLTAGNDDFNPTAGNDDCVDLGGHIFRDCHAYAASLYSHISYYDPDNTPIPEECDINFFGGTDEDAAAPTRFSTV